MPGGPEGAAGLVVVLSSLMSQLLRYAILTGLFAILFIPFIVAGDFFFPFITGKNFTFRIIVEIIFALWLILTLSDPSVRPKKSALLFAIGGFVAWMGLATVFAENPNKAFWSNFERMEGYITILHIGAYFLVASSMVQTEKLWKRLFNTSIVVSVLVALYGVAQLMGWLTINQGGVRVDATFGNATYLAVYMLFHVFLTLYALFKFSPATWLRVGYGAAILLQALMIFYAGTRGTLLGLLGGLALTGLLFAFFSKENPRVRSVGAGLVVALLIIVGSFFLIKDANFVRENDILTRIASISLQEGQTRFTIWNMALQGSRERPILGWGQDGFNFVFNTYYSPTLYGQEPWFDRAHNIFLDWLIAGGLPALLLYLSLFAIALWYLWGRGSRFDIIERSLFTGLFAGYSFHNLFVFDNLMSYVLFFLVLAFIAYRRTEGGVPLFPQKAVSGTAHSVSAAAILVVLAAVLYAANIPGMVRAAGIITAIQPHDEGVTRNFEEFKKVIGPSGLGRQEAHEQLLSFAAQLQNPNLFSLSSEELRREVALFALDAFKEEISRQPNDARLQVFYGSFLRTIGDTAGAALALDRAQELSPKKQQIYFERAALALNQGDAARSLSLLKEAHELEPRYDQARLLFVSVLVRAGRTEEADALLLERYNSVTPPEPGLIEVYSTAGNRERLLATAQALVEKNQDNFQFRLQLAGAYLESGNRASAISELREAIRLNSDFQAQGEAYIGDIEAGRPLQ